MSSYNIEHTLTESSNGGTLLYSKRRITYKLRKYLQILKSKEPESKFLRVLKPGMLKKKYDHRVHLLSPFNEKF